MFSSYRSAARFESLKLLKLLPPNVMYRLPLFICLYMLLSLLLSLLLPPHVLALAITLHLHNPLFLSSNVIGIFEFHMLSGPFWFSFFPGTRFGAAPWEARCCFEQCRIRSRKGCFVFFAEDRDGKAELALRGGKKSSPTNRTNPSFSHEGFRAQGTSMPPQLKKKRNHSFLNSPSHHSSK